MGNASYVWAYMSFITYSQTQAIKECAKAALVRHPSTPLTQRYSARSVRASRSSSPVRTL